MLQKAAPAAARQSGPGPQKVRIGVLGASGYTGADLVRLALAHPAMEITALTANSHAGKTMAEVLQESTLIPAPVASMLAAAERTGKLPETLDRIADAAEHDLDEAIKTGTQMIEPAMIIIMGGVIGGIAVALLLPIFTISNVMAH